MSTARYALERVGFAVVSVFAVLTALFGVFAFVSAPTPSTVTTGVPPGTPSDGSIPLHVRYLDWLWSFCTLDFGELRSTPAAGILEDDAPATIRGLVGQRLAYTATYVLPGFVTAVLLGTVVGYDTARSAGTVRSLLTRIAVYAAFGIPTIVLAVIGLRTVLRDASLLYPAVPNTERPPWDPYNLVRVVVPAGIVTLTLLGSTARHARSAVRNRLRTDAVRLVEAKGGGYRTVARHVLRRVSAQLVAAVAAETLGLVLLASIMIEIVFQIGGFGRLLLLAAIERQPALVAAVTFVTALFGIGGSLLADLVRALVDPRVTDDG